MAFDFAHKIVVRWDAFGADDIRLLKLAGIRNVLCTKTDAASLQTCAAAGITAIPTSEIQPTSLSAPGTPNTTTQVVFTDGIWPGIRRPPSVNGRGDETASASREPWVDSNGYLIGCLRALYPNRPAVLGYTPNDLGDRSVPFDTLELALIEAWVAGGNYILALEPTYKEALLRNDAKAVAAWEQLGRTSSWLQQNITLFRQSSLPIVTALIEPGTATTEIANLLYRRNVAPLLQPVAIPPNPKPEQRLALVAVNLKPPQPALAKQILANAEAGSTVIVATPPNQQWWRTPALKALRTEPDREFFTLGNGKVVAYRKPIADPSEFALDVIDIIAHARRAVRLWNAPAVIALATLSPNPGERLLHLVNYGSPIDIDTQVRIQGQFARARLLRPDGPPIPLQTSRRGTMTEVQIPELKRVGVVVFT